MKLIYLIATVIFFQSCTRVMEIDIPPLDSKLVVNAYFSPDSTWQVRVSRSIAILDTTRDISPIMNALVTIKRENTQLLDTLIFQKGFYVSNKKPEIGQLYTLKVEAAGYPVVTASDRIPLFPNDLTGKLDTTSKVVLNSVLLIPTEYYPLTFSFKDPISDNNFYKSVTSIYDKKKLKLDTIRRNINFERQGLTSQDPSVLRLHQEQDFMLFDDKLFANKTCTLLGLAPTALFYPNQLSLNEPLESQKRDVEVYLEMFSISENMYLYEKSYYTQQFNLPDPFSEPNNVFSNVKNGYGIFAGYQNKRIRVF
jgi:Domain of unknown function (DUF4249)